MEDKEIENILKESANNVKLKDFNDRWDEINPKLDLSQNIDLTEKKPETVLVTSSSSNHTHNNKINKYLYSLIAVFLVAILCLAIILPLTLKNNDRTYFNEDELTNIAVSESEFYDKVKDSDLNIVDFSKFEINKFVLLYSPDDILVGGMLEFIDEELMVFTTVTFYDSSVISYFNFGEEHKDLVINETSIIYNITLSEDLYEVKALANSGNINYEFECLVLDEEINGFFNKIFG